MDDSTIRVVATIVSILLILTALLIVWLVVKYNSNDKPSVVAAYFMVRPSLKDKSPKFEDLDD
jgi:hypothetical protein